MADRLPLMHAILLYAIRRIRNKRLNSLPYRNWLCLLFFRMLHILFGIKILINNLLKPIFRNRYILIRILPFLNNFKAKRLYLSTLLIMIPPCFIVHTACIDHLFPIPIARVIHNVNSRFHLLVYFLPMVKTQHYFLPSG